MNYFSSSFGGYETGRFLVPGYYFATLLMWLIYLLNVRYNKADRKMQENYKDQIYWLEMNNDLVESLLRKQRPSSSR